MNATPDCPKDEAGDRSEGSSNSICRETHWHPHQHISSRNCPDPRNATCSCNDHSKEASNHANVHDLGKMSPSCCRTRGSHRADNNSCGEGSPLFRWNSFETPIVKTPVFRAIGQGLLVQSIQRQKTATNQLRSAHRCAHSSLAQRERGRSCLTRRRQTQRSPVQISITPKGNRGQHDSVAAMLRKVASRERPVHHDQASQQLPF